MKILLSFVQVMLGTFNVPATYVAFQAVLSLLIRDARRAYVLPDAQRVTGRDPTEYLMKILTEGTLPLPPQRGRLFGTSERTCATSV